MLDHITYHGQRRVESGGFLLCCRGEPERVSVVALAGSRGIRRAPDQFQISGTAIERLSEWADRRDHYLNAQFHSHGGAAFLSPIDKAGGFRVNGFVSAVIPDFGAPPADPTGWAWFRFGSDWAPTAAPRVSGGSAVIVEFDERGVR